MLMIHSYFIYCNYFPHFRFYAYRYHLLGTHQAYEMNELVTTLRNIIMELRESGWKHFQQFFRAVEKN